ncbi:hypothetical protein AVEN_231714-1, partial [Araneus ventricosus]
MQHSPYTADLQSNWLSNVETSVPEAKTLPLGHHDPLGGRNLTYRGKW